MAQPHVRETVFGASHLERGARNKALKRAVKLELIAGLRQEHKLNERKACKIVSLRRSVYRYRPKPNRDQEVVKYFSSWSIGYRNKPLESLFQRLWRLGHKWNHKRVYRIYGSVKLNKR